MSISPANRLSYLKGIGLSTPDSPNKCPTPGLLVVRHIMILFTAGGIPHPSELAWRKAVRSMSVHRKVWRVLGKRVKHGRRQWGEWCESGIMQHDSEYPTSQPLSQSIYQKTLSRPKPEPDDSGEKGGPVHFHAASIFFYFWLFFQPAAWPGSAQPAPVNGSLTLGSNGMKCEKPPR